MKPQDSLHGSEQTKISSAPLARMLFGYEKQKFLLLRIQKLCDSIDISIALGKKLEHFFWRLFLVKFKLGLIWY